LVWHLRTGAPPQLCGEHACHCSRRGTIRTFRVRCRLKRSLVRKTHPGICITPRIHPVAPAFTAYSVARSRTWRM
jgi:hypothetical protein